MKIELIKGSECSLCNNQLNEDEVIGIDSSWRNNAKLFCEECTNKKNGVKKVEKVEEEEVKEIMKEVKEEIKKLDKIEEKKVVVKDEKKETGK